MRHRTCGIASTFPVGNSLRVAVSINGAIVYFENGRFAQLGKRVLAMADELKQAAAGAMAGAWIPLPISQAG